MFTTIYCQRHGEKDADAPGGDALTEFGRKQVKASADAHLSDAINHAFFSGMHRALQTAEVALAGRCDEEPIEHADFGYAWIQDERLPQFNVREVEEALKAEIKRPTVYDWLERWPVAFALRERFAFTLRLVAMNAGKAIIYVASHSPTCEMAVPDPRDFPRLSEGDIVRYVLEGNGEDWPEIVSAEHLPCPPVK